ncbi:dipicolinic acid synthetase subunit A [Aquibacillus rhizosphaerae]|uniref:Dipicolinic acid synthetase subunit A n=1 Tax=Aquibacillus rhizosphaerae TaxID=3051431 RepID=A0ABT7L692_9BACI|nr:dipicolinic acid synthetase subunit A [Aquibacillus sp. LR5S19]MDL4840115.1 dipicolinic acid synthetase subunit A [Aquibacillus sp. LR5S19]
MNKTKNIAVLGGDARYLEMVKNMSKSDDIHIELVGFDQLNQGFTGAKQIDLDDLELSKLDAVILPIPGTDGLGYIETVFSDKNLQVTKEWFKKLSKHCLVFSGIANDYLINSVNEAGLSLIPLMERNDVAIYNSIPTVEGTIMIAIQNTDFTIHSSNVIVLGLGRVGMSVASKFAGLGADVHVGSRSKEDIARATEMGVTAFHMNELSAYTSQCNILINTVPALVVTNDVIKTMQSNALIIDLASKPGGTDFDYAEKRGIKALHSLGLPGIVAPKTAGEILGTVVEQIMYEQDLGEE